MRTNLTGLSLEPDRITVTGIAEFGQEVEVEPSALSIFVPEHFYASIAHAEDLSTNLQRAIAWAKREQAKRAGGAA